MKKFVVIVDILPHIFDCVDKLDQEKPWDGDESAVCSLFVDLLVHCDVYNPFGTFCCRPVKDCELVVRICCENFLSVDSFVSFLSVSIERWHWFCKCVVNESVHENRSEERRVGKEC